MPHMMDVEVSDVVRIILQFCRENGLSQSYAAIEQECQISLNTVDNIAAFVTEIQEGRWDVVLPSVARLGIPQHKLEDLYEHVAIECAESLEFEAGKTLLQHAAAMTRMRQEQPQRYAKIERIFMQPNGFDAKEAYRNGSSRKKRREALAKSLASEVIEAQPARLLVLLNQALKWQKHKGIFLAGETFDVLRESASGEREKEESVVTEEHCVVSFGKRNHAECASFRSPTILQSFKTRASRKLFLLNTAFPHRPFNSSMVLQTFSRWVYQLSRKCVLEVMMGRASLC